MGGGVKAPKILTESKKLNCIPELRNPKNNFPCEGDGYIKEIHNKIPSTDKSCVFILCKQGKAKFDNYHNKQNNTTTYHSHT